MGSARGTPYSAVIGCSQSLGIQQASASLRCIPIAALFSKCVCQLALPLRSALYLHRGIRVHRSQSLQRDIFSTQMDRCAVLQKANKAYVLELTRCIDRMQIGSNLP